MKGSKGKSSKPSTNAAAKTGTANASSQGTRTGATGTNKNTKEAFLKKLKLCMQSFDYKDEAKDVKGKTDRL
jgi:hypothetical protein